MLEVWLDRSSNSSVLGYPRSLLLPDGSMITFTSRNSGLGFGYTIIDFLGNTIDAGNIEVIEGWPAIVHDVHLHEDGTISVLFGHDFNSLPDLYLVRLDANLQQIGDEVLVVEDYSGTAEMRVLSSGEVAVVYGTVEGSTGRNVAMRLVDTDGTVGSPVQVNTSANPNPLFIQVASNDQYVFSAWLDVITLEVRGQMLDFDGNLVGAEFALSSSGVGSDNRVMVEALPNGNFIAVWSTSGGAAPDSDGFSARGRLFGSDGTPLGDEFLLSDRSTNDQFMSGLSVNDDGTFFVTWYDSANGRADQGAQFRWFDGDGTPLTDALAIPDVGTQNSIVSMGDGRVAVFGRGFTIVDTRMGVYEGDEGDNRLVGSNVGPSDVYGFGGNDIFYGGAQDETFHGGEGNDEFRPGLGANTLIGGPGDDIYYLIDDLGVFHSNTIVEQPNEGTDTVYTIGDITLPDNVENAIYYTDVFFSGDLNGNDLGNHVTGNELNNGLFGMGGNDTLLGLAGNDRLQGGEGDDWIEGGEGNDLITGGAGADHLLGGNGEDSFFYSSQAELDEGDYVDGGDGDDHLNLLSTIDNADISGLTLLNIEGIVAEGNFIDFTMTIAQLGSFDFISVLNASTITLVDGGSIVLADHFMVGGQPTIQMSDTSTTIDARAFTRSSMLILGGAGDDTMWLGTQFGELRGGGGNDQMFGNVERDYLFGEDGEDWLDGGAQSDYLDGGDGADMLRGGADDDTLEGGSNIDTAIVSGNRADYTVTQTELGVFQVVGADGSDQLTNIEFLQFDDETIRLLPGTGVSVNFETADPSVYQDAMNAIRDFDGNVLGGDGSWLRIGSADIDGDGDIDQILVNDAIGRFATVGTAGDGLVYFNDHSWAGETRVAGIYIDPLVQSGDVEPFSDADSQRRFQNDLQIENINRVLGADDYDGDGLQEVYLALTDGTAYLHLYMHADGNIQYANYQSEQQVIDFLTANGFTSDTWADWFPDVSEAEAPKPAAEATGAELGPDAFGGFDRGYGSEPGAYMFDPLAEVFG